MQLDRYNSKVRHDESGLKACVSVPDSLRDHMRGSYVHNKNPVDSIGQY